MNHIGGHRTVDLIVTHEKVTASSSIVAQCPSNGNRVPLRSKATTLDSGLSITYIEDCQIKASCCTYFIHDASRLKTIDEPESDPPDYDACRDYCLRGPSWNAIHSSRKHSSWPNVPYWAARFVMLVSRSDPGDFHVRHVLVLSYSLITRVRYPYRSTKL